MNKTIEIPHNTELKLALKQRGENISLTGLRDLKRYYALLNQHRPDVDFSVDEAILFCKLLQHYSVEEAIQEGEKLLQDVMENESVLVDSSLQQKWSRHHKDLVDKIQPLSILEKIALVDAVEQVWVQQQVNPQLAFQEILHQCDFIHCCDFAL